MLADQLAQDERTKTLREFATILDLPPIAAIVQRGDEKLTARYILHLADGRTIDLGGFNGLWSQAEFRKAILVKLRQAPRPVDKTVWPGLIENVIENGIQAEIDGERFQDAVAGWAEDHMQHKSNERDGAAQMKQSFTDGGQPYIYLDDLMRYIRRDLSEPVKRIDVKNALEDLDYERRAINYRKPDGSRSTRSYYVAQAPPGTGDEA